MSNHYKVLITRDILALPKPSSRDRQRVLSFIDGLASDPFQKGDFEEKDDAGRPVQIKIIGRHALTFWSDHGAKEVKITRIDKADKANENV
jgi:hypothetical protein